MSGEYGHSSIGRATVSKTVGCGFDSCCPCKLKSFMEKVKLYLLESYNELVHKVTWPTWASLMGNTTAVVVASAILMLFIFLMDGGSNALTKLIYGLNGN